MKFALLLTLCAAAAAIEDLSDVRVLTDSTFEHDTQAASGATTGNWFVLFYAPWCGWCKRIAPDWELLASEVKGEFSVAKIDATQNMLTPARFGVKAYPMLILFSHNKMYKYEGQRSYDELLEFSRNGYKSATGVPVPPEKFFVIQYAELFGAELAV